MCVLQLCTILQILSHNIHSNVVYIVKVGSDVDALILCTCLVMYISYCIA